MAEADHRLPRPAPRLRRTAGGGRAAAEAAPTGGDRNHRTARRPPSGVRAGKVRILDRAGPAWPGLIRCARAPASPATRRGDDGSGRERTPPPGVVERSAPGAAARPSEGEAINTSRTREESDAHYRTARLLHDQDGPLEEVAGHLLAAEPEGRDWVAGALRAAARLAAARGDSETAVAYLRRALREPPSSGPEILLTELGRAEAPAYPAAAVRHLSASLDALTTAPERLAVVPVLADALERCQRGCQAAELLDREARSLTTGDRPPEEASFSLDNAVFGLRLQRVLIELEDLTKRPWTGRGTTGLPAGDDRIRERAVAAVQSALTVGRPADAATVAAYARDALDGPLPQDDVITRAMALGVLALVWCDQLTETARILDRLSEQTQWCDAAAARTLIAMGRYEVAYRSGDLAAALDAGRRWLDLASASHGNPMIPLALAGVLRVLLETGRREEAEPLLARAERERYGDVWQWTHLLEARARLRLADGEHAAALDDLLECGRRQTAWQQDNPAILPWRSLAALAHRALGRSDRAARLARQELEQAEAWGAPRTLGISLRTVAVTVRGREGLKQLETSVGLLEEAGATLEQARSLVEYGTLRYEAGHARLGRETARRGLELARQCGAEGLADLARERLQTFGARPRRAHTVGASALTDRERRVAVLAARGLTNREIADTLFITQRTVENHLTSGFRKLGITRRRELAPLLDDEPS
ncbi:LuxR C-terminal-related transcriptional regulator [Streptomyces angustmyceticus]|uniref:LuxR C-terminal-related transcriptional regulator n=1 Tax=Streptomyces angustmyceticus TaxID=285578 RepID=UPI0036AE97D5